MNESLVKQMGSITIVYDGTSLVRNGLASIAVESLPSGLYYLLIKSTTINIPPFHFVVDH
jgi:hypothetical protein